MSRRQIQQPVQAAQPVEPPPQRKDLNRLEQRLLKVATSDISRGLTEISTIVREAETGNLDEKEFTRLLFAARYDLEHSLDTIQDLIDWEKEINN